MFFRKKTGEADLITLDAGALARIQAKAAQVAAGVYRFWDQGITVDVSFADGRQELDNTLFGVVEHSTLRDGSRYRKKLENFRPYTSWRAVVGGDTHVRLVLQPSPSRMVRTFNEGQPTDWIGSIVLVPKSEKALIGLVRLRSDLPSERNAKLLQRVMRLFAQHSGGVEVRAMGDEEAVEHGALLPQPLPPREKQKTRWQEATARRDLKRSQDEARYEDLVKASATDQPMPFQTWVSQQSGEALWTYGPQQLAAFLAETYGGPGVVDAFYSRGMKHALRADVFSVKHRPSFSQLSDMESLVYELSDLRQQVSAATSRDDVAAQRNELRSRLRKHAEVAEALGLNDLAQEYHDEAFLM